MIHPRVILVTAEVVATMRGISREAAYALADGADFNFPFSSGPAAYQWVFNVATHPTSERELRFWARELNTPAAVQTLTLDEVIRQIVPRRDIVPGQFCGLPNWQVGDLLRVSRATLLGLRRELQAVPHAGGIYVPRAALETFFRRRWCYASPAPAPARRMQPLNGAAR
jgi:hypothetical protein